MIPNYPTTKTEAAIFLRHVIDYLEGCHQWNKEVDYNDHKAAQGCEALADMLIAEACMTAWFEDLGFDGVCQGDNNSIGSIPCIES